MIFIQCYYLVSIFNHLPCSYVGVLSLKPLGLSLTCCIECKIPVIQFVLDLLNFKVFGDFLRLDSNIETKSWNNTYLNIELLFFI